MFFSKEYGEIRYIFLKFSNFYSIHNYIYNTNIVK